MSNKVYYELSSLDEDHVLHLDSGETATFEGDEGQPVIFDAPIFVDRSTPGNVLRDTCVRIANRGGTGIHGQPAEHGAYVRFMNVVLKPEEREGAKKWESVSSIGWKLADGTVVALRDAKRMHSRRDPKDDWTVQIIHSDTPRELWEDNPWSSSKGARPRSLEEDLIVPGGRRYGYRVIEATNPLFVEVDDWSLLVADKKLISKFLGAEAELDWMPPRMRAWIEASFDVGSRTDENGDVIFSDMGKGSSFPGATIQGAGRWDTWNVDAERDLRDMPEAYHKHPAFWPDHAWNDGHDNCHYELVKWTLREYLRWADKDSGRAFWAWWSFSRFSHWTMTSGLVQTDPARGGKNLDGMTWGEKSVRGGKSVVFVGGFPSSFAITSQKLFTANVIASAALNYHSYKDELNRHRNAVLRLGEGDEKYGSRDMWWILHAKIRLDALGRAYGDDEFMPDREIVESVEKILDTRDDATGLWPNYQQVPSGRTNCFEDGQICLGLMEAFIAGYRSKKYDLAAEIEETARRIRDRFVGNKESDRPGILYQWTPDGVPGYVTNGRDRVNLPDRAEFTRPIITTVIGMHALLFSDAESKNLFAKLSATIGDQADWAPRYSESLGSENHELGSSNVDKVVTAWAFQNDTHPGHDANWLGGAHYSSWWKSNSFLFILSDAIGVLRKKLNVI